MVLKIKDLTGAIPARKMPESPKFIVIHYTGVPGATASACARSAMRHFAEKGLSAHFYVDKNEIVKLLDVSQRAAHVGAGVPLPHLQKADRARLAFVRAWHRAHPDARGNSNSVGIEVCCDKRDRSSRSAVDGDWFFDAGAVERLVALTAHLCRVLRIPPSAVCRHFDMTGKLCPRPFLSYPIGQLDDPGEARWQDFIRGVEAAIDA